VLGENDGESEPALKVRLERFAFAEAARFITTVEALRCAFAVGWTTATKPRTTLNNLPRQ
jgi:F0F1-type ATP synthase assembly protein I